MNEMMNSFAGSTTTERFQRRGKDIDKFFTNPDLKLKGVSIDT